MSVSAAVAMRVIAKETLTSGVAATSGDATITHGDAAGFKTETTLNASSTPAVSQVVGFTQALSGGAATIDLTSLTGTNGASVDLSGLKVQVLYLETASGDAAITAVPGVANGYNLGGDASFSVTLAGGESALYSWNETSPDVAAGAKDIDLSGTGTDSINVLILAG